MIKGTRFFSRRLLPLLLAAVMLLGMLPALTLPVLALPVLAEDPPASQKLTNTTEYSRYLSRCCWNWTRSITGRRW